MKPQQLLLSRIFSQIILIYLLTHFAGEMRHLAPIPGQKNSIVYEYEPNAWAIFKEKREWARTIAAQE